MRILVLLTDAFGGIGGIAEYNRTFLHALADCSDDMEIIALPRIMPLPFTEQLPPAIHFIQDAVGTKPHYCMTLLKILAQDRNFDCIVSGHLNLLPLAAVAKGFSATPILQIIHRIEAWEPPRNFWLERCTRSVHTVASVSSLTLERFSRWGMQPECNVQTFLLPGAVDTEKFTPGPVNQELAVALGLENAQVLLTVARLALEERYKGVDEVLEALSQLSDEMPRLRYVVVGDGTDRSRLIEKARQLGVSDKVRFVGYIPEEQKLEYYRLADAFVLPGRKEGLGIVYLEALACGIPAMGSVLDGSREALKNGELGVLVDPNSMEEVKRGIREVLSRPKGTVLPGTEHFSEHSFRKRLRELMSGILPSSTKP